ncbi:TadE family protein [Chloroflexus islandicus]|uniref:TadE family protein n=1 Tax=Chloroflexus islandicus TaxID=1707952 RepID=UPI0009EE391D|nr:TadE family protein [Chloroflexus islandicus]
MHLPRPRKQGQALVETALIVTVLIVLLMGMFDAAMAINVRMALRSAVAEAGYVAAQNPANDSGIRNRVRTELNWLQPPVTDAMITIARSQCNTNTPQARIEIRYPFRPLFFNIGPLGNLTLNSETTVPLIGGC